MPRSNQWRRTLYRERIEKLAPGYDPAHVEAWVRLSHLVLDALSADELASEVKLACKCIDSTDGAHNDRIAERYGLRPKKRAS